MELKLPLSKLYINNTEKFENKPSTLTVFTGQTLGLRSFLISLSVENNDKRGTDESPEISIELNKNQALYLANTLLSFVNEIEVDLDDED